MQNFSLIIFSALLIFISCSQSPSESQIEVLNDPFFVGEVKWDPQHFSPLPDWVPFEMKMQIKEEIVKGTDVLRMELKLYNPTEDPVYLWSQTRWSPSPGNQISYDFIVLTMDSIRVWNKNPYHFINSAHQKFILQPGESRHFEEVWDFTDYNGAALQAGNYLVYAGIEFLRLSEDGSWYTSKKLYDESSIKNLVGRVGAGVGPVTLVID